MAEVETIQPPPTPPSMYASSDMALLVDPLRVPDAGKPKPFPIDPLRSFEADTSQQQTDLRLWMNPNPEDRAKRLVQMEEDFARELHRVAVKAQDPVGALRLRESRWRAYSYIIWRETQPIIVNEGGKVGQRGSPNLALAACGLLNKTLQPVKPVNENAPRAVGGKP